MNPEKWQFRKISSIEDSNFNSSLKDFLSMGVSGLVRENIQNSLDGKLENSRLPVIVKINTGQINTTEIPGINEIITRIKVLEGQNVYTRETIEHMQNQINKNAVKYISFEDKNTKGLTGAKNGETDSKNDTWNVYAYKTGVHFEEDDKDLEIARGGSHGVGKIASNAASDIHLMYFANCDVNNEQHLGGTVQLIEHNLEEQRYRSTGYFSNIDSQIDGLSKLVPFDNNFGSIFKKESRGLKIIIPFLRDNFDNEKEIIKSVCDSFFVAILNDTLKVEVNNIVISKDTILSIIKNEEYYEQNIENMKSEFTPLYLNTYLTKDPMTITVNNIERDYHFDLYFNYDETIPRGRVAIIRTIGMKIEDFKVKSNVMKPFNAVLIGGLDEDAYLKSLENESHTKLDKDKINDRNLKSRATRFLNNLSREIAKIIEDVIQKHNPVDGMMDTDDILYVVEAKLENDLKKRLGTVKVNRKGGPLVKTGNPTKEKEKRDPRKGGKKQGPKKAQQKRKRNPFKKQKSDNPNTTDTDEEKELYLIRTEAVQRIILNDTEVIKFEFENSETFINLSTCDIKISVIDGMGREYKNEFNIESNYVRVIDENTKRVCAVEKDMIKNVSINNGIVHLQMILNHTFNRALKFIYYVEV